MEIQRHTGQFFPLLPRAHLPLTEAILEETDECRSSSRSDHVLATAGKVSVVVLATLTLLIASIPLLIKEAVLQTHKGLKSVFLEDKKTDRPRVLMLVASDDELLGQSSFPPLNHAKRNLMAHYQVEMHRVSCINDVNRLLLKSKDIAAVWFSAHSNQEQLFLNTELHGNDGLISKRNIKQLKFSALPEGIPIILESCETGSEKGGVRPLAQEIADVAKGHPVFAPKKSISEFSTVFSYNPGEFSVQWRRWRPLEQDSTILDTLAFTLSSAVLAILPSFIRNSSSVTSDITSRYLSKN